MTSKKTGKEVQQQIVSYIPRGRAREITEETGLTSQQVTWSYSLWMMVIIQCSV
jgi:hypothetical protein